MKKIVVISGSPRKNGDSSKLVRLIEEKMKRQVEVEFEYIFLRYQNLEFCRGCMLCMKKGEENCPINDDAPAIRQKVLSSDGMIFASPVYEHQVTALMKNFFDRFVYFMHRPAFHNKPALIVSSTELSGLAEAMKYMEFPVTCWGFSVVDKIGIIPDAFQEEGPFRHKTVQQIEEAVANYVSVLNSKSPQAPTLKALQFFNVLKTKIIIHRKKFPYDYDYWKQQGWLDAQFFYETRINPVKRFLGELSVEPLKFAMKKRVGALVFAKMFTEPLNSYKLESES